MTMESEAEIKVSITVLDQYRVSNDSCFLDS